MKIVISISQRLHHHERVISRANVPVIRPFPDGMPDAVDGKRVVQVHAISRNNASPISNPKRLLPEDERNKHRNQHNEQQKRLSEVSILKHDRFVRPEIADIN